LESENPMIKKKKDSSKRSRVKTIGRPESTIKPKRKFGVLKGKIKIAKDFDSTLELIECIN